MNEAAGGQKLDLHFLQMDLEDLKTVKAAAQDFCRRESRLDLLINNAGVRRQLLLVDSESGLTSLCDRS